jgi:hypothetical protein
VIETRHQAAVAAATAPAVVDKLKAQVMRPAPSKSIAEAKTWLADEMTLWRKIVAEVKIEMPD